jgi:hypothetical protein
MPKSNTGRATARERELYRSGLHRGYISFLRTLPNCVLPDTSSHLSSPALTVLPFRNRPVTRV